MFGRHQGELVKEVVSKVWGELRRNHSLVVNETLVGIGDHVEEMLTLLSVNSSNVRIVGIYGMGGIGKTTIAKVIYNQLSQHFDSCCFLADVRETAQHKGLVHLQNQLISNILTQRCADISTVDEGTNVIKERFSGKKVLVVVDDADHRDHLQALALVGKCEWFGSGSRIIVTTRKKEILNPTEVNWWTYEPKELDFNQSLQLFSRHAFRTDRPPQYYDILSMDVVFTAGGLPLVLEIIGSFLSGKGKEAWEDTLKQLERIPVQHKLIISFRALETAQKNIFLDIACLFTGVDRRIALHMWNGCGFYPEHEIEVLRLMSLVKIGDNNELMIHDLLRDLGREIVCQESVMEPGKRSRVWFHEDAYHILNHHTSHRHAVLRMKNLHTYLI
ncbi:disease resistance protein L6-like [Cornus florida]|uniref:disease resistance protein L6-like n=1 Tax=Cornus florida TaxID=4283 RepID=UPI00289F648F|nr:disease resistance protein L6-like [Cornus florida]